VASELEFPTFRNQAGISSRCREAPLRAFHPVSQKEQGVSHSGTSRVVLVVEDEWAVRYVVALELRSAGWDVLQATTAESAIECVQAGCSVDVIITDIRLAFSGGELWRRPCSAPGHLSGFGVRLTNTTYVTAEKCPIRDATVQPPATVAVIILAEVQHIVSSRPNIVAGAGLTKKDL
jgi:CheY-like chemotaxis protein